MLSRTISRARSLYPCADAYGWAVCRLLILALLATCVHGQTAGPANVLVVVNDTSSLSRSIGEYYVRRRAIPLKNVCRIQAPTEEVVSRQDYDRSIAAGVVACLRREQLTEQVLYIVTTQGVPLRVEGTEGIGGTMAAVDSELSLLYLDMRTGKPHNVNGSLNNPYFRSAARFSHPEVPIYLVTRLAGVRFCGSEGAGG